MAPPCSNCGGARRAAVQRICRPPLCRVCFLVEFEDRVHQTLIEQCALPLQLHSKRGSCARRVRVALGASGGKDSTVLAHVMKLLNEKYEYGLELVLLSIDEGIAGYRDDSLETVRRNQQKYELPLTVIGYEQLYNGWSMDKIVKEVGHKNNCTFCGVFRRQALDRGAALVGADCIATGHNADDIAETVLLNLLRGDISRLTRCVEAVTGEKLPRIKPFKYTYEKDIVMYAHFRQLDYFSTECKYAPFAYRGFAREYLKELERIDPHTIINIIDSAEHFRTPSQREHARNMKATTSATCNSINQSETDGVEQASVPVERRSTHAKLGNCERCGYVSSNRLCHACVLLEGLNKGRAKLTLRQQTRLTSSDTNVLETAVPSELKIVPNKLSMDQLSLEHTDRKILHLDHVYALKM